MAKWILRKRRKRLFSLAVWASRGGVTPQRTCESVALTTPTALATPLPATPSFTFPLRGSGSVRQQSERTPRTQEGKCGARRAKNDEISFDLPLSQINRNIVSDSMSSLRVGHLVFLAIIFTAVSGKAEFNHYRHVTHWILNISDMHRFNHSELSWLEFSAASSLGVGEQLGRLEHLVVY